MNFKNILIFTAGAAIGSVVTWRLVKTNYENKIQEEIDSVKEAFSRRENMTANKTVEDESVDNSIEEPRKIAEIAKEKPDIAEYTAKLQEAGYIDYSSISKPEKEEKNKIDKPYVITPNEFGEFDDYEKISLIYYADKVLTDDDNELVEDVDDVIGLESLEHFGEYEPDSVFVRNDRLKADYEILLDEDNYSDVVKRRPHSKEE